MSNSPKKVFRGNLKYTADLINFFKDLDEWTKKEWKTKNYAERLHGGYIFGVKAALSKKYDVDPDTIQSRIMDYPNGVNEGSRIKRGESSEKIAKWEQTTCFERIKEKVNKSWDNKRQFFNKKGQKYNTPLYRAWQLFKQKDPLKFDWADWNLIWGTPAKTKGRCMPQFMDEETQLIRYDFAVAFRFAMQNSVFPDIKEAIITKDQRYDTKTLKRTKGKHKDEFQSEEQILALPEYIHEFDTLMLDYCGILFGGRFEALSKMTPSSIKREASQVILFESKVQKEAPKSIYEPEKSFIYRYVTECGFGKNERIFPRSISQYNKELTEAAIQMGEAQPALQLTDGNGNPWFLTTHRGFKHTCITQMSLHGVRSDTISDYVKTDPNTIAEFYRGGSAENIDYEIGGIEREKKRPSWRGFVKQMTAAFEKRFNELKQQKSAGMRAQVIAPEQVRA